MIVAVSRLWRIHAVIRRYRLQELWNGKPASDPRPRGERLRLALQELGTVFIKFGQALSTRPDVLPPDIAGELMKLQDQVPPFPTAEARALIEAELGKPIAELFARFDDEPLASASVAQVHTAQLPGEGGIEVCVKVIRPGIEKFIAKDIALLRSLAGWVERLHPEGSRLQPVAIVAEYEKTLYDELDLAREGANAAQLRRNWLGSELIYHPLVFWDYTRGKVLTLERLYGHSVRELDHFRALGVDFSVLAGRGVEIFFKQVFRDNFFHADMHPGNIFVDVSNPRRPSYLALDFGIVGQLTAQDQRYLAENFLAFFNRDYKRIAELHVESGWIPEGTRVEDFESAIRTVCEPIFGRPIKDISFGYFLLRLFQIARRFKYQVQPQLVLLQKTLLQVEGLGRQLYPDLDLWQTAKPIMEDWMKKRLAPSTAFNRLKSQAPALAETLPLLAENALKRLEKGESLGGGVSNREFAALRRELLDSQRRTRRLLLAVGALIAAVLLYGYAPSSQQFWGLPWGSWLLGAVSVFGLWRAR
ncbi:MAG: ubiquinone biosynthesis regulatory protein kinase UbiB [Stagnimonas sp.]|nr:ubiquinone biosynthesis regulatory protein kinase UbiB [Stagnimonas sp.]